MVLHSLLSSTLLLICFLSGAIRGLTDMGVSPDNIMWIHPNHGTPSALCSRLFSHPVFSLTLPSLAGASGCSHWCHDGSLVAQRIVQAVEQENIRALPESLLLGLKHTTEEDNNSSNNTENSGLPSPVTLTHLLLYKKEGLNEVEQKLFPAEAGSLLEKGVRKLKNCPFTGTVSS
jgi:hypothetical protein